MMAQWELVQQILPERQLKEKHASELRLRVNLSLMGPSELEATRNSLLEQLREWQVERDRAQAQLQILFDQGSGLAAVPSNGVPKSSSISRKLSFGRKEKPKPQDYHLPDPSATGAPPKDDKMQRKVIFASEPLAAVVALRI